MKKILLAVAGAAALLVAVVLVRTIGLSSRQIAATPAETIDVEPEAAAERLGRVLRQRTISPQDPADFDPTPFLELHAVLAELYPRVHATLKREVVNGYSLLYTWQGADPNLEPIVLMAHMDVVPVEPGTETKWDYPAFSGLIEDGFVWGRGALDDKGSLTAILEAVEALLASGYEPQRTIYLAFGHDEEIGGKQGAAKIAALLKSRGVHLAATIDEGMVITEGLVPGISRPLALIAIAEKGFVSLRLTARAEGGHSSMPPERTAVGALAEALVRLKRHRLPASLSGPAAAMFDYLAPEMGFWQRLAFANRWLFGGLILRRLERNPVSNALVRTTTAPTMIDGGIKENVLPSEVHAVVNFRIRPGETIEDVRSHVARVIDDPDIDIEVMKTIAKNPSPVADANSWVFRAVARALGEVIPEALVAPGLVVGGTDSVHYEKISGPGYRFVPYRLQAADLARIHGTNERVSVANFAEVIKYYGQLIHHLSEPASQD